MSQGSYYDVEEEVVGVMSGVLKGHVYLAEEKSKSIESRRTRKKLVAIKKYDLDRIPKASEFHEAESFILGEVSLMRNLRHPHLLPLLHSFYYDSGVCLVSPYAHYGSIRNILDNHYPKGLPELWILSILRHVLLGLEHLHAQGIIHRSIRASHILLDEAGNAILSGFRYASSLLKCNGVGHALREKYEYSAHVASTNLNWLSPEILAQKLYKYTEKSDIYSLGVTTCEIANGTIPFSDMETSLMLLEKLRGTTPKLFDASTMEQFGSESELLQMEFDNYYKNKSFSDDLHNVVEECTQFYPESRPSANGLLCLSVFRKWKKGGYGNITVPSSKMARPFKGGHTLSSLIVEEENESDENHQVAWNF